ncbi:hypothetical protein H8A99_36020 [Bradyrhizobium sp. Arg68]|uniref:hypothetical protein n=1 Tax=Bradyrhizobium ivorense TaxID=2511166 RepID=UPI001E3C4CCC|nr:hypothetical protein [Bradyrhizobium ivorense]MCC8941690.1 hypothetical protein [Bradyrhizobium ivorense]
MHIDQREITKPPGGRSHDTGGKIDTRHETPSQEQNSVGLPTVPGARDYFVEKAAKRARLPVAAPGELMRATVKELPAAGAPNQNAEKQPHAK